MKDNDKNYWVCFQLLAVLFLVVFYFDGGFKFLFNVRLMIIFCTGGKAKVLSAVCMAEID
jgi:hypothetical protein